MNDGKVVRDENNIAAKGIVRIEHTFNNLVSASITRIKRKSRNSCFDERQVCLAVSLVGTREKVGDAVEHDLSRKPLTVSTPTREL